MKYTVEFPERVSNSAFIYYVEDKRLFGCDLVIRTNYDEIIYQSSDPIPIEKLRFVSEVSSFESPEVDDLETKIKYVESVKEKRNWNCIRIDREEEFDLAIKHHLTEYKRSVEQRLKLSGRTKL